MHASSTLVAEPVPEMVGGRIRIRTRKAKFPETYPHSSVITWDFPARGNLPPVRMHWYEGGLKPPRPEEIDPAQPMPIQGLYFVGEKGVLWSGFSGGPSLLPEARNKAYTPPPKTTPRTIGHYKEWIEACKGGKSAHCNFDFGSLITEAALLGVLAIRTGKQLYWDAENLRITNEAEANQYVNEPYRAGWVL